VVNVSKRESQFDVLHAPGFDKVHRAIDRFEIERFARVLGPAIGPLKEEPAFGLSQESLHRRLCLKALAEQVPSGIWRENEKGKGHNAGFSRIMREFRAFCGARREMY
jgi:hypothetical protein